MAPQYPQLVAVTEGANILLDKPILLIGRHQECDIQIPSRKVSRRHCCIAQVDDHLVVRDLCSTNGIRINGMRVNEGCLKSGDELTIGNFKYSLLWPEQLAPAAPLQVLKPQVGARNDKANFESNDEPVPIAELDDLPLTRQGTVPPIGKNLPHEYPMALPYPDNIPLVPLSDSHLRGPK
jgi:predicted component of type VI protein secretion system